MTPQVDILGFGSVSAKNKSWELGKYIWLLIYHIWSGCWKDWDISQLLMTCLIRSSAAGRWQSSTQSWPESTVEDWNILLEDCSGWSPWKDTSQMPRPVQMVGQQLLCYSEMRQCSQPMELSGQGTIIQTQNKGRVTGRMAATVVTAEPQCS